MLTVAQAMLDNGSLDGLDTSTFGGALAAVMRAMLLGEGGDVADIVSSDEWNQYGTDVAEDIKAGFQQGGSSVA